MTAAIVLEVEPGGPAHEAGIVIGDILVSLGGRQVAQLDDIQSQLHGRAIGEPVPVKFIRGGAIQEASILIGERLHGRK
jgi:S1-C subfamily serine protease